ncbi:hypothetical protein HJ526_05235 [Donghicola sp. C2-DW-16]|uniref:Uncharacterized protein n=1 Tax=Donghicola mangrovi TaxID=2729614 RepID=A0ABX2PCR0_9RHOB|nr:hypothetical protein [Donghicola mangrovi]NVO26812.1 hypothetical protein [Donghicola mangrovi]
MNAYAFLERSVSESTPPTVDELGGVDAILADRQAILASPFLDVLVESIGSGSKDEQTALAELVIDGLRTADMPTVFRDAVAALFSHAGLRALVRGHLVKLLIDRVGGRRNGNDALIAAYALEAMFRLGMEDRRARLETLLLFEDLDAEDDGLFVQHAVKIVGVACHHWGEPDLRKVLIRLQANGEAADEAAFELAMIAFADALNADDMAHVQVRMREARALFQSVLRHDGERYDAAQHVAVIDIVSSFAEEDAAGLGAPIEKLGRLLAVRHDQLGIGVMPSWLAPRVDREIEWWALLRLLRSVDSNLRRESWLDAGRIMEQVLAVYDAERTILIGGALHALFLPRIEAAFVRSQGLAAHLQDLLDNENWTPEERSVAEKLREQITKRAKASFSSRKFKEDGEFPELGALLQDPALLSQVPDEMARRLEGMLADKLSLAGRRVRRDVQRICHSISTELIDAADYRSEVRAAFDELVQKIVAFCDDRQNADRSQLGDWCAYLRSADAIENHLQRDLREWLRASMPGVGIFPEVPGMAAGRSDLYVDFGDTQFVIELKRHHGVVSEDVARSYRAQAVAYQATGPKLGLLGILELVDRSGPPPSLVECIWIETYVPEGSTLVRHLVVFKVPGMLKPPSKMT